MEYVHGGDIYTHKGMTDCESESVRTWKSCSGSGKKVNRPNWKLSGCQLQETEKCSGEKTGSSG